MDVHKIEVLLRAVENGSLLMTANELGYSQAGLTQMMKSLESEIGVTLLHRGKFGVRPTEEGKRLMPMFQEIAGISDRIEKEVEAIHNENASLIRLAAVSSVLRSWLPDVMAAFRQQYPDVVFEVKEGAQKMYKWFDQGTVDLCITCNIVNREDFVTLTTDEFFACLPEDYPIGEGERFPLKRIEEEPYISASCGEDYDIKVLLDQYDIHPTKLNTFVDDASVLSMVARGFGISLIPKMVLQSSKEKVKAIHLDRPCYRRIGVIHGKRSEMSPAVKAFVDFLRQWNFEG